MRDSFNVELEKMKKKIDSMSFKNTECCTFEDVRDVQLSNNKKKQIYENGKGKIKKITLEKLYNKHKSSNYVIPNIYNSEKKLKIKEDKKNESDDESDSNDLFEKVEEKEMIERLNRAFYKYGKEANKDNIKSKKDILARNLLFEYE